MDGGIVEIFPPFAPDTLGTTVLRLQLLVSDYNSLTGGFFSNRAVTESRLVHRILRTETSTENISNRFTYHLLAARGPVARRASGTVSLSSYTDRSDSHRS